MAQDIEKLLNPFHGDALILEEQDASALLQYAEGKAKSLGIETPMLLLFDHEIPNAMGGFFPFEKRMQPFVALTTGKLKHIFNSPDLNVHVPEGLKGTLAHEMWHIAEGPNLMFKRQLPLFAIPALSLAGYELYMRAKSRHQQDPAKNISQHLDDVTEAEKEKSTDANAGVPNDFHNQRLEWAKRLAVIGGGLVIGGLASRHISLANEFAADRQAILAVGNPEIYIESLAKTQKIMGDIQCKVMSGWAKDMSKRSFMENVSQIYKIIIHDLQVLTIHAHPSKPARDAAMRQFAKEQRLVAHGVGV